MGHDDCISVLRNKISEHTDRLDIVINNAGIPSKIQDFSINSISTENILNLFNIHTLGAVRVIKSSIDLLKNAPQPKIINISSRLGSISKNANGDFEDGYSYAYRIAKAAQNMFTASLSQDLKTFGICTAAIHPGRFQSELGPSVGNISAEQSAKNIIEWIESITLEDSGTFSFPSQGHLPW